MSGRKRPHKSRPKPAAARARTGAAAVKARSGTGAAAPFRVRAVYPAVIATPLPEAPEAGVGAGPTVGAAEAAVPGMPGLAAGAGPGVGGAGAATSRSGHGGATRLAADVPSGLEAAARAVGVVDPADTGSPEDAFDALYLRCAEGLRRQVVVLTGDRELAGRAVGRAFDLAWQRWPEVARDEDPVGWLRAAAHTYALATWQRHAARLRRRGGPAVEGGLWGALVRIHPERRRALLLHDGLGMSLPRTAAEVESSTRAAASRIIGARRELAAAAPEVYDGGDAATHLADLLTAAQPESADAPDASGVREASERGTRRRTVASFGAAGAILLVTTVCMIVGPQPGAHSHHDAPAQQQATTRPVPSPAD